MLNDDSVRILVVANRTCPCPGLHDRVEQEASSAASEVLVIAPALNDRTRHWASDIDGALGDAKERLEATIGELTGRGVDARGQIGDADPYIAIDDALAAFEAHRVIVSTHPPGQSHWLERDLPERVERELEVPVIHVVSEYGLVT